MPDGYHKNPDGSLMTMPGSHGAGLNNEPAFTGINKEAKNVKDITQFNF